MNSTESGVTVMLTGVFIFLMGLLILFDKGLVIAGDLIITAGIAMVMGSRLSTLLEAEKILGSLLFCLGMCSYFLKYMVLGIILKIVGVFYILKRSIPNIRSLIFGFVIKKFSKFFLLKNSLKSK